MRFLLVNENVAVKKLFNISAKKADIELDVVELISKIPIQEDYSCIFIDDGVSDIATAASLKNKMITTKFFLIIGKNKEITGALAGFDNYIKKPFLPTAIYDIFKKEKYNDMKLNADSISDPIAASENSELNIDINNEIEYDIDSTIDGIENSVIQGADVSNISMDALISDFEEELSGGVDDGFGVGRDSSPREGEESIIAEAEKDKPKDKPKDSGVDDFLSSLSDVNNAADDLNIGKNDDKKDDESGGLDFLSDLENEKESSGGGDDFLSDLSELEQTKDEDSSIESSVESTHEIDLSSEAGGISMEEFIKENSSQEKMEFDFSDTPKNDVEADLSEEVGDANSGIDLSEFNDNDDEFISGVKDEPIGDISSISDVDSSNVEIPLPSDGLDGILESSSKIESAESASVVESSDEIVESASVVESSKNGSDDIDFNSVFAMQDEFLNSQDKPKSRIGGDIFAKKETKTTSENAEIKTENDIAGLQDSADSSEVADIAQDVALDDIELPSSTQSLEQDFKQDGIDVDFGVQDSLELSKNPQDEITQESPQIENENIDNDSQDSVMQGINLDDFANDFPAMANLENSKGDGSEIHEIDMSDVSVSGEYASISEEFEAGSFCELPQSLDDFDDDNPLESQDDLLDGIADISPISDADDVASNEPRILNKQDIDEVVSILHQTNGTSSDFATDAIIDDVGDISMEDSQNDFVDSSLDSNVESSVDLAQDSSQAADLDSDISNLQSSEFGSLTEEALSEVLEESIEEAKIDVENGSQEPQTAEINQGDVDEIAKASLNKLRDIFSDAQITINITFPAKKP